VKYLALDISGLNASLVGLADVLAFNAWDIGVLLNRASDSDGNAATTPAKLDWSTFAVSDGIGLPDFKDVTKSVDLSISGAATLNVLSGLVVLKVGGFTMQLGQVSGSDGTTTLTDARAMTVTLTDVTLWVGPGGSLDDGGTAANVTDTASLSDDTVVAGDLGFSGYVASLTLATLKDLKGTAVATDDVSYLALDISGLNARLVGLEDVLAFNAWDQRAVEPGQGRRQCANDPAKLNWKGFMVADGLAIDGFTVDAGVDVDAGLRALAPRRADCEGSFRVQFGTVTEPAEAGTSTPTPSIKR
jgi:hypothetical protein